MSASLLYTADGAVYEHDLQQATTVSSNDTMLALGSHGSASPMTDSWGVLQPDESAGLCMSSSHASTRIFFRQCLHGVTGTEHSRSYDTSAPVFLELNQIKHRPELCVFLELEAPLIC